MSHSSEIGRKSNTTIKTCVRVCQDRKLSTPPTSDSPQSALSGCTEWTMRCYIDGSIHCETNSIGKDFQVCFMAFPIRSNLYFNKIRIIANPLSYNRCLKYTLANLALIGR